MTSSLLPSLLSYLLGSIPASYLVVRALKGIDLRTVGSGNLGATNTFRAVGWKGGVFVLAIDVAKGFVAAAFVSRLVEGSLSAETARVFCGVLAILGHMFSPFVRFRGGKGIATAAGAYVAIAPLPCLVATGVFSLAFGLTRIVSVGSMAGALSLPLAVWLVGAWKGSFDSAVFLFSLAISLVILLKHRSNIRRLRAGEEKRLF